MSRAGGTRTHMGVTPADFKSAASAISPPPHGNNDRNYIPDGRRSQTARHDELPLFLMPHTIGSDDSP